MQDRDTGFGAVSNVVHLLPVCPREKEAETERDRKKGSCLYKLYIYSILSMYFIIAILTCGPALK